MLSIRTSLKICHPAREFPSNAVRQLKSICGIIFDENSTEKALKYKLVAKKLSPYRDYRLPQSYVPLASYPLGQL